MEIEEVYQSSYLRSRLPPASESQVAELENRLGISLPDSYRNFIIQYNGAFFQNLSIKSPDDNYDDGLDAIWGLNSEKPSREIGSQNLISIFDDNEDPVIIFPIGYTNMGVLLLTFVDFEEERGQVYGKYPSQDEFVFLGDNIESFFHDYVTPNFVD